MLLPPFLLIDDSAADTQTFVALVKRIGLANSVRSLGSIADARDYLSGCAASQLPVVVFSGSSLTGDDADALAAWMDEQDRAISAIPTVTLCTPLDMHDIIRALKALALPERARIDTMTLTVRVELWPHGTAVDEL